jgi:hypothetical protein
LDAGAWATLVGALFAGAAVLVGNWTNRYGQRLTARDEELARTAKLKALVAAELVNVAIGHIQAKRFMNAAHTGVVANGAVHHPTDLTTWYPRLLPLTDAMGPDLLVLEAKAIDALTTLRANLALTKSAMEEITDGRATLGLLRITAISNAISHDLECLSAAFREFAPNRQLQLPGAQPALVTALLEQVAAEQPQ